MERTFETFDIKPSTISESKAENLKITDHDIKELSKNISSSKTISEKIEAISLFNENKIKTVKISNAEGEIKKLCNAGFIIRKDNDFLHKTYGFIDKDVNDSIEKMCLNEPFTEIQGIKFHEMTKYGRDITLKNILLSNEKLNEINLKKISGDPDINPEFRISDFTIKNYFDLKNQNITVELDKTYPGTIAIRSQDGLKTVHYEIHEKPSIYLWNKGRTFLNSLNLENNGDIERPLLGRLDIYKNYIDGFKNISVSIDGKKVLEMESHHNWDKVRDYIKWRDLKVESGKSERLNNIQIHHVNQLQDGGRDNVKNYIALNENRHKLVDSCDIPLNKHVSEHKEKFRQYGPAQENTITDRAVDNLLNSIEKLSFDDKKFLNGLKSEVESHAACQLDILVNKEDALKLRFIDFKTKEVFLMIVSKSLNGEERIIMNSALQNFVKEFTTGHE